MKAYYSVQSARDHTDIDPWRPNGYLCGLKTPFMKHIPFLFLLLVGSMGLVSCGGDSVSVEGLEAHNTACTEQMGSLSALQGVIKVNQLAMTHPFTPSPMDPMSAGSDQGSGTASATAESTPTPTKDILEGLPEERILTVKKGFAAVNENLNVLQTKSLDLQQQITTLLDEVAALRKELEGGEVSPAGKEKFAAMAGRIDKLKSDLAAFDKEVADAQQKNLEFLKSDEVLSPGVSYLLANSSKI